MFLKVFVRTLLNTLFVNNFIIGMFIKICNKNHNMPINSLKIVSNVPIKETERRENIFFQSFTGDTIDYNG